MSRALVFLRRIGWLATGLLLLSCGIAGAQQSPSVNRELEEGLRYAQGLQDWRLPQFAEQVIAELEAKYPEAKARFATLKLSGLLAQGKFDEVKQIIAAEPDQDSAEAWAMKLSLGDYYYAYGKYAESKGVYEAFFNRFADPPPELKSFYSESAYKYAQMLLYLKELRGSLKAYKRVLQVDIEDHIERQCMAEMANIAIRIATETSDTKERDAMLREAEALADKLLWVLDIWFGKAIVLKAHVAMIRGQAEAAKKLVDDYMPTLRTIHDSLVQQQEETGEPLKRISPMAECRYLLAVLLQEEAERLMKEPGYDREEVLALLVGAKQDNGKRAGNGAFQHFINVFLQYPESAWAAQAGERSEQVRRIIVDDFGGQIKTVVTEEQIAKVRTIQYRDARLLYAQGQIEKAIERLRMVLNQFPEASEAVPALGDLARGYIQTVLDDPVHELYADMVLGHLAERYSADPLTRSTAGDEVVRLAEYWLEAGRPDKRAAAFDRFFEFFPEHPMAVSYLASFGERNYQEKNYAAALSYFKQVAEVYTNSPRSYDALNRIATIYEETGAHTNHIAAIEAYVERLGNRRRPGQELMSAQYRQAQAYKNYALYLLHSSTNENAQTEGNAWIGRAAVAYNNLADILQQPDHPYQAGEADRKKNDTLLEAALYNTAYCLSQVTQPQDRVPQIRRRAIESYEALVKRFPRSEFAPPALIQIGSIWTILREAERAEEALSRLLKEYPDTPEARSALPMIAGNLMKLGMREEAIPRYRQMFAETGAKYSDSDLLQAAQVLMDAREYELAQQGVERVLARANSVGILAPARLLQAELMLERGQYDEAVKNLKDFIEEYPQITLMVDANLLLSRAASEVGMRKRDDVERKLAFNTAVDAMKAVRQRRTNNLEIAQSDIEIGRIMARKARAEEEFGLEEKAAESRGMALIAYQSFIDNTDPGDLALGPLLETAYAESIPLLLDHEQWRMAIENCESYLAAYPRGRYLGEVRAWLNQARIELGQAPGGEGAGTATP